MIKRVRFIIVGFVPGKVLILRDSKVSISGSVPGPGTSGPACLSHSALDYLCAE